MKLKGISSQQRQHLFPSSNTALFSSTIGVTTNRQSRQLIYLVSPPKKVRSSGIRLQRKFRISMENLYKPEDVKTIKSPDSTKQIESVTTLARTSSSIGSKFYSRQATSLDLSRVSYREFAINRHDHPAENSRMQQIFNTYYQPDESTRAQSRTDCQASTSFHNKTTSRKKYDIRKFVKY